MFRGENLKTIVSLLKLSLPDNKNKIKKTLTQFFKDMFFFIEECHNIILGERFSTVKPDLTTTCEQRPPVNDGQFKSATTSLNLSFIRHLCQTATFFRSQGWPLYTGMTVVKDVRDALTINRVR
jgi:hypothetical protein